MGLEQNIIDTAINEWRKRLRACVHIWADISNILFNVSNRKKTIGRFVGGSDGNVFCVIFRLQRILPPKMPFSFVKKCKCRQNFCHKFQILPVFRHLKMRPFQQCITATAVNVFYEVLPKQFEAFSLYFFQEKKQVVY